MNFLPGGKQLPGDWVDEGKLLLFIKTRVVNRPPKKGARLNAEKKRKAAKMEGPQKRRKPGDITVEGADVEGEEGVKGEFDDVRIVEGDDDALQSELVLMYNTVRGYVSAINELWAHQVSRGEHNAPKPENVAIKALKTTIVRGQHAHRRKEFTDRGVGTITDGYLASQIPDLTRAAWAERSPRSLEQSLRTQVDFLFGNSMLLRLSNRLSMELPDLFALSLPKEGQKPGVWCLVAVMDQGKKSLPPLFPLYY